MTLRTPYCGSARWARPHANEEMAKNKDADWSDHLQAVAVGQQRLLDLHMRGEVLDDNLHTAPGKFGGGGAGTTWLVGSAADVARSLRKYQDLGLRTSYCSTRPTCPRSSGRAINCFRSYAAGVETEASLGPCSG